MWRRKCPGKFFKIFSIFLKKGVDKGKERWYLIQAVWHRQSRSKKTSKKVKKGLDKWGRTWYSKQAIPNRPRAARTKKFEKTWKKFLTNASGCAKIATVPPMRRAPCKLNNVTNEKHQTETFLVECRRKGCQPGFSQLPGMATKFLKLVWASIKWFKRYGV